MTHDIPPVFIIGMSSAYVIAVQLCSVHTVKICAAEQLRRPGSAISSEPDLYKRTEKPDLPFDRSEVPVSVLKRKRGGKNENEESAQERSVLPCCAYKIPRVKLE